MSEQHNLNFSTTIHLLAGVDEAGRGPLAGAVFAAAVILDPARPIAGLADSKMLSASKRERLAEQIKQNAISWAISSASVDEIDELNILWASMLAMKRALYKLPIQAQEALIDGNCLPKDLRIPASAIIKGDVTEPAISAASILAKTARDAELVKLDKIYPAYGFAQHKGYPTAAHIAAIKSHGVLIIHRKSFSPIKRALLDQQK